MLRRRRCCLPADAVATICYAMSFICCLFRYAFADAPMPLRQRRPPRYSAADAFRHICLRRLLSAGRHAHAICCFFFFH